MWSFTRRETRGTECRLERAWDGPRDGFLEADRAISHLNTGQIDGNVIRASWLYDLIAAFKDALRC